MQKRLLTRRKALAWLAGLIAAPSAARATGHQPPATPFAQAVPGYRLRFPHDEGSHPEFRLEWWYITGWLNQATRPLGFQVTFFRARPDLKHDNPSRLTPRQIVIAHAALSDPALGRLSHAQRAARAAMGLAGADEGRTRVWIDDWTLAQEGATYRCRIPAREASLDLAFQATQPPLLQGEGGLSRKGPDPESASYYYSVPQLKVSGSVARDGKSLPAAGVAWLDHEWSSQYMDERADGWDWLGVNLDDGSALMAFRMRGRDGGRFWAGGALRGPEGRVRMFAPEEVHFLPSRQWRSPRTGAAYPVACRVRAADIEWQVEPLFDDQEHDTRASTGTVYWEGAVRVSRAERPAGLGYLELTGYWRRPQL
jgi:predicted secreted hydrolase